eukprot:TRINITY_DN2307_c0_g1_i8.p2 TRINITY_DN2307_c0_g1~~TRINITY_DN2307_c0_g1_i8.p2  ORF type:complete len:110 (+),score=11.32 TRINITY_DN2307_c0_g1_i8:807-1136(+)
MSYLVITYSIWSVPTPVNKHQIMSSRSQQCARTGRCSSSGDFTVKKLKKRKPYVGTPTKDHERILIDKRVSIAETARKLDTRGYDGSYSQIQRSRYLGRAPEGLNKQLP